jgi:hypothetical protein
MKRFRFFQKGKPYWLTLSKFGEPITMDSIIVGVSPLSYEPDFSMKRRLIFWSEGSNRHFYGPWIKEDNKHFNLPQIDNPILE